MNDRNATEATNLAEWLRTVVASSDLGLLRSMLREAADALDAKDREIKDLQDAFDFQRRRAEGLAEEILLQRGSPRAGASKEVGLSADECAAAKANCGAPSENDNNTLQREIKELKADLSIVKQMANLKDDRIQALEDGLSSLMPHLDMAFCNFNPRISGDAIHAASEKVRALLKGSDSPWKR